MADAFLIGRRVYAGDGEEARLILIGQERGLFFEPGQGITTTFAADLAGAEALFDAPSFADEPLFVYASTADAARAAFARFENDGFVITAIDETPMRRGLVVESLGLADPDNLDPPPGERPEDFRLVLFDVSDPNVTLAELGRVGVVALEGPAADALAALSAVEGASLVVSEFSSLDTIERVVARRRGDGIFVPAEEVDRLLDLFDRDAPATILSPFTDDAPIVRNQPDPQEEPEEPEEPPEEPEDPPPAEEPEEPEEPAEPPASGAPTEGNDTIEGGADPDVIEGGGGRDRLSGFQGRDTLFGGDGNDTLRGGVDNDRLRGGEGDDVVRGQGGADRLFGQAGDDTLIGANGADTLKGGAGDDRLVGGGADDRLFGGLGDDTLIGSAGADRLVGSAGDDALTGGTGADRFIFRTGGGDDTITDFEEGADLMRIQNGAERFADLTIEQVGADVVISFADASIRLLGVDRADVTEDDFLF